MEQNQQLEQAKVALGQAIDEVRGINAHDLTFLGSLVTPQPAVAEVTGAIATLIGEGDGGWQETKRSFLNPKNYIDKIVALKASDVPENTLKAAIQEYEGKPENFGEDLKKKSSAAGVLGGWLVAFVKVAALEKTA